MEIYKRHITSKLFIARLLFAALILLSIYNFINGQKDYGYLIIILLLLCCIFQITDLVIYSDKIEVRQFFLFGIFPHKIIFEKYQTISLSSFDIELNDAATYADMDNCSTNPVFLKMFILKQEDERGKVKKVKLKLSEDEFQLIKHFIKV